MNKKARIAEIEIVRVFAALAIMLFHMNILPGGQLAVEIFAVLSGLLMASSVTSMPEECKNDIIGATYRFVARKIRAFYPELIVATLIGVVCFNYAKVSLAESLNYIFASLTGNLLLLKMSGFSWCAGGACPPSWYLSSMIISMILICPFLLKVKKLYFFLAPGVGLFLYLYFNFDGVEKSSCQDWLGFTYGGNIRVCSELLIAIGAYPIVRYLGKCTRESVKLRIVSNACKWGSLTGILVLLFKENGYTDLLFLILAVTYFICLFAESAAADGNPRKWSNPLLRYCGVGSIAIFLTHSPALMISGGISTRFDINAIEWVVLSFIVTSLFSLVTIYGGRRIRQMVSRTRPENRAI